MRNKDYIDFTFILQLTLIASFVLYVAWEVIR